MASRSLCVHCPCDVPTASGYTLYIYASMRAVAADCIEMEQLRILLDPELQPVQRWPGASRLINDRCGAAAVVVSLVGLVAQSLTFNNIRLTVWSTLFYMALIAPAVHYHTFAAYSIDILVCDAFLRIIGHMVEPAPPLMFDGDKPQLHFRHKERAAYNVMIKYVLASPKNALALIWAPVVGLVSELQAGLPCRLLHYAVLIVLQQSLGARLYGHQGSTTRAHILTVTQQISAQGWNGWSVTKGLFHAIVPEEVAPDSANAEQQQAVIASLMKAASTDATGATDAVPHLKQTLLVHAADTMVCGSSETKAQQHTTRAKRTRKHVRAMAGG
eukprot:16442-Heterococcus_DN1.PRE.6